MARLNGASGTISCDYGTEDGDAIAGHDFVETKGTLSFAPGEALKTIKVKLLDDFSVEKDERFRVHLTDATGGSNFGYGPDGETLLSRATCEVTISDDPNAWKTVDVISQTLRMPINQHAFEFGASSWAEQFRAALDPKGEDADAPPPSATGLVLHYLSLPWKLAFALVPPVAIGGGYVAFFISLGFIGLVTAIIGVKQ